MIRFSLKCTVILSALALMIFSSNSSMASCLSESSNLELWKEFKKRNLSDNDRVGNLSAICNGSSLKLEIENDQGKKEVKEYSFPTTGVASCKKYQAKINQGSFFKNELISYCGGSRCYSVKANADGTFTEQFRDFNANAGHCEKECSEWAKSAHPGFYPESASTDASHSQ